jgi:hypothetical protein
MKSEEGGSLHPQENPIPNKAAGLKETTRQVTEARTLLVGEAPTRGHFTNTLFRCRPSTRGYVNNAEELGLLAFRSHRCDLKKCCWDSCGLLYPYRGEVNLAAFNGRSAAVKRFKKMIKTRARIFRTNLFCAGLKWAAYCQTCRLTCLTCMVWPLIARPDIKSSQKISQGQLIARSSSEINCIYLRCV